MFETIGDNLKDPSWWFSAFFVAVLASIIAGFTKDYLERRYGLFIAWSQTQKNERRRRRESLVATWSATEGLVIITILHALAYVLLFGILALAIIVHISYLRLKYSQFTNLADAVGLPWDRAIVLALASILFIVISFRTAIMVSRASDVVSSFCQKHRLTPFDS